MTRATMMWGQCLCQKTPPPTLPRKRNAKVRSELASINVVLMKVPIAVLPHERLFLNHLPNADRYHKSFMHRDVINFVVVTRCVPFFQLWFSPLATRVRNKMLMKSSLYPEFLLGRNAERTLSSRRRSMVT